MSFENSCYIEMREKVEEFLNTQFTDKELIKMKDYIRGLHLQGLLSEPDCSSLLCMLPTLNKEVYVHRKPKANTIDEVEDDSSKSNSFSSVNKGEDYSRKKEAPVIIEKKGTGFSRISSDIEYDDVLSKIRKSVPESTEKKQTGFSKISSSDTMYDEALSRIRNSAPETTEKKKSGFANVSEFDAIDYDRQRVSCRDNDNNTERTGKKGNSDNPFSKFKP